MKGLNKGMDKESGDLLGVIIVMINYIKFISNYNSWIISIRGYIDLF